MASTGLINRKGLQAELELAPPLQGEIVFATDFDDGSGTIGAYGIYDSNVGVRWTQLIGTNWGTIIGDISTQVDLQDALALKENVLGVPTQDGMVLVSTIAGVRTWSNANTTSWGDIQGTLSLQVDLQAELNNKEIILGNPTTDGDVLSSTIAGLRTWITPTTITVIDDLTTGGTTDALSAEQGKNLETAKLTTSQGIAVADSVAGDVATLVTDFNNLLASLRTAGIIAT